MYPAPNIRSLNPSYLIYDQKQLEITMWASQIYILKRFSWPAFETIDVWDRSIPGWFLRNLPTLFYKLLTILTNRYPRTFSIHCDQRNVPNRWEVKRFL